MSVKILLENKLRIQLEFIFNVFIQSVKYYKFKLLSNDLYKRKNVFSMNLKYWQNAFLNFNLNIKET